MGKKFKGKLCAYCAKQPGTTVDHVFAREFFLQRDRAGLPTAPACVACNNAKSGLEHYLTAVLPVAGRHPQAEENINRNLARRLAKNPKARKELLASQPAWLRDSSGIYQATGMFEFDGAALEKLLVLIARGLVWHHWGVYMRAEDRVGAAFMPDKGSVIFQQMIAGMRPHQKVVQNLGRGTVEYVGVQAIDPPELSVWHISMYAGVILSGGGKNSGGEVPSSSVWCIITGPPAIGDLLDRMKERASASRGETRSP